MVDAGILRVGYGFFAGVLLRLCWRRLGNAPQVPAWLLSGVLALVLAAPPSGGGQGAFDLVAVLVVFPVLIWFGASNPPGPRLAPAMAWVGAVSYAVYVLQWPIYNVATTFFARSGFGGWLGAPMLLGFVQVGVMLAVSAAATQMYDLPVRRVLRQGLVRVRLA